MSHHPPSSKERPKRSRWETTASSTTATQQQQQQQRKKKCHLSDQDAMAALVASAQKAEQAKRDAQPKRRAQGQSSSSSSSLSGNRDAKRPRRWDRASQDRDTTSDVGYYGPAASSSGGNNRRSDNMRDGDQWGNNNNHNRQVVGSTGEPDIDEKGAAVAAENKKKPNFGLSGALAKDSATGNVYKGVVLKFSEPPEARAPNTQWRLYVFKGETQIETLHISKQSAYLFGRSKDVADIVVEHPSLSQQHCVLQYRAVTVMDDNDGGSGVGSKAKLRCKPYLMDLESTNGTFLNGVKLDSARYYELRKGDVIKLGGSTREYVLLTQHATST